MLMLKYKYSKAKGHWKNAMGFGTHLQNPNGAQATYFLHISSHSVWQVYALIGCALPSACAA